MAQIANRMGHMGLELAERDRAPHNGQSQAWYLGLDLSSQGVQATLAPVQGRDIYPLAWQVNGQTVTAYPIAACFTPKDLDAGQWSVTSGFAALANSAATPAPVVTQFQHHLQRAVPFYSRRQQQWQPRLHLTADTVLPLHWFQRALKNIIGGILPTRSRVVMARPLSERDLLDALRQVVGVVVACPHHWGATYRFNLREVILSTNLVSHPEQIFCVDRAIAIALTQIATPAPEIIVRAQDCPTVALAVDANTTEVATWIESSPDNRLNPERVFATGHNYGITALCEDIFYQLLYPQWFPQHEFLTAFDWPVPRPGEADFPRRDRATRHLHQQPMGQTILALTQQVLAILQHQPQVTAQLGRQPWQVDRATLEREVFTPFVAALNPLCNHVLSLQGTTSRQIRRVLWQASHWQGLAPLLAPWLQQKFPQARLVNVAGRLADGLAQLPRYPHFCDRRRHQYDDYFLLQEILQAVRGETVTLSQLCQALRQQGLNPKDCRDRVAQCLKGELPAGLCPDVDDPWIAPESQQAVEYRAIRAAPLFTPADQRQSQLHPQQVKRLQQYLTLILTGAAQTLRDPLTVPWLPVGQAEDASLVGRSR